MSSVVVLLVFVAVIIVFAAFFWFWRTSPIDQVPPHLDDKQLRRLEVQDRIRQTNYQVLTALGLGATFLITLFQFTVSTQHWSAEFDSRLRQERLTQFAEAVKQISQADGSDKTKGPSSWTANLAGIRVLASLGAQQPEEYHAQAQDILSTYVKERTVQPSIRESPECSNDFAPQKQYAALRAAARRGRTTEREEAPPGVQAAMTALGEPKFASFRRSAAGYCSVDRQKPALRLEHLFLDNLNLSNLDLSCSTLTNSHFRRVSLQNTDLSHADLRGIRLADWKVPGSPAAAGEARYKPYDTVEIPPSGEKPGLKERLEEMFSPPTQPASVGGKVTAKKAATATVEEWKLYRCWVSDLRSANLTSANLEGSTLSGVDFRNANLTNVDFCRADISRANFQGAIGLDLNSLRDACAGGTETGFDYAAQPLGLPSNFPTLRRCDVNYKCANQKVPTRIFENSSQKGADFSKANLTGVRFCHTDVSGANFQNAVGLNLESLKDACAGEAGEGMDLAAQPKGLPASFPQLRRCGNDEHRCKFDGEKASGEGLVRHPIEPIQLGHNLVLACFLALAWIAFALVGRYAKRRLEVPIGQQTVEFPSRFPERSLYTAAQLSEFVRKHPARSRFYAFPVLFPLDLIVMLLLGAALATASYYWALRSLPVGSTSLAWLALVLPALYVIADLIEDTMLARTLTRASTAFGGAALDHQVKRLKRATRAKFIFIIGATVQTLAVLVVYSFVTSCNWTYFAKACAGNSYPNPLIAFGLPTDLSFLNSVIGGEQPR